MTVWITRSGKRLGFETHLHRGCRRSLYPTASRGSFGTPSDRLRCHGYQGWGYDGYIVGWYIGVYIYIYVYLSMYVYIYMYICVVWFIQCPIWVSPCIPNFIVYGEHVFFNQWMNGAHDVQTYPLLDKRKTQMHTMWGPPVISWFISPSNYSYKYHKP